MTFVSYDYLLKDQKIVSLLDRLVDIMKRDDLLTRDNRKNHPNATWKREDWYISEEYLLKMLNSGIDLETNEKSFLYAIDYVHISKVAMKLIGALYPHFKNCSILNTGKFIYPEDGFMGWHTNSNHEGQRLYFTYVPEGEKSYFAYYDKESQQIIKSWDKTGWTARGFECSPKSPFWHCVSCEGTPRYSIGFNLKRALV